MLRARFRVIDTYEAIDLARCMSDCSGVGCAASVPEWARVRAAGLDEKDRPVPNDPGVLRSRRGILTAALAAAAASVASALGHPQTVRAGSDGDVVVGALNSATTTTTIENLTTPEEIFRAESQTGKGIVGISVSDVAVIGISTSKWGVAGFATVGTGVHGAASGYGVHGLGSTPSSVGVFGEAGSTDDGTGVLGQARGHHSVGVHGFSADGTSGQGFGTGVLGQSGIANVGDSPIGRPDTGVVGFSPTGTGIHAGSTSGTALQVAGRAKFSTASRVKILKGASSYRKTVAGLTRASQVFAVLSSYRAGVFVAAVVPTAGSFTIYLNKALPSDAYCSYFIVN